MLSETVGQRGMGTFSQVPSVVASTAASAYGTEMVTKSFRCLEDYVPFGKVTFQRHVKLQECKKDLSNLLNTVDGRNLANQLRLVVYPNV